MGEATDLIARGFTRYRRDLLLASLILFFYQSSEVVMDSINLFGTTMYIKEPSRVTWALWIVWCYFFLRYYQYFHDTVDKGFSATYHAKLDALVKLLAQERFKRDFVLDEEFAGKKLTFYFKNMEVASDYPNYHEIKLDVDWAYADKTEAAASGAHGQIVNLSRWDLAIPRLRAILHVILSTRLVTEYLLPFAVAILPVVYQGWLWVAKIPSSSARG